MEGNSRSLARHGGFFSSSSRIGDRSSITSPCFNSSLIGSGGVWISLLLFVQNVAGGDGTSGAVSFSRMGASFPRLEVSKLVVNPLGYPLSYLFCSSFPLDSEILHVK
jgi:hypothetical protein